MKFFGKALDEPTPVMVKLRPDLTFKCKAVFDFSDFDRLCPEPRVHTKLVRGTTVPVENPTAPAYLTELRTHNQRRHAWLMIASISETDGLEWEKVDLKNPDTWLLWRDELKDAHILVAEINLIIEGVMDANCLSDKRIAEASNLFSPAPSA